MAAGLRERHRSLERHFLVRYVREKDVKLFLDVSHTAPPKRPSDLGLNGIAAGLRALGVEDRVSNRRSSVSCRFW